MKAETAAADDRQPRWTSDLQRRVLEIDPHTDPNAVRRYALEIEEAHERLSAFAVDDAVAVTGFTPDWTDETTP